MDVRCLNERVPRSIRRVGEGEMGRDGYIESG